MFPNDLEFQVHLRQEHYKGLLCEAERSRLIRQVQAGQERRERFHHWALTWLGRRLVVWGWRLQEHYGAATAAPALQVANRTR